MFIFLIFFLFKTCVIAFEKPIVLEGMNGNRITFASLKGHWVFINYWASWCDPCVNEIKELNQFYEHYDTSKVALYAVSYEGLSIAEQKKLIKKYKIHYPSLSADPSVSLNLGDIPGVPVTFVFNPQGDLVDRLYGGLTHQTLMTYVLNRTRGHHR